MKFANRNTRLRPLADVVSGENVEVLEIIFDTARLRCHDIGVRRGDVLSCEERTPLDIALRRKDGTRVLIDPFLARFVAIRSHGRGTATLVESTY